ncbi:hypothetical protein CA13_37420 [Planctomycetes bacterium CA13]|uniref:Uncharacterized protein n=1 Tax=Novipirellula herctigrandis TaxID=2527986 RepID=A0A5C5Z508_9BACT|nr:hypothetical protein CA13_37420 [Planctomycetes bacterium CA13]
MRFLPMLLTMFAMNLSFVSGVSGQEPDAAKIRIGTYDNRSIAVAYAASPHNPVAEKMVELDAAKKNGDEEAVKRLNAWGKKRQRLLHFQGFAHVPVGDLLAPVTDQLADIATKHSLVAIVRECDYLRSDVETIDVTEELVELFQPNEKIRNMARKIRDAKPVELTVLSEMSADK